jgi:hypothetical protein
VDGGKVVMIVELCYVVLWGVVDELGIFFVCLFKVNEKVGFCLTRKFEEKN